MESPAVLSISYTSSTVDMVDRMLSTLGSVIVVLIVSAGMLAFVVLYNLNNINITERQRELATLKVLGFFDMEVSQYVLRENILLTIAGILAGTGIGILLHRYIIMTIEVDAVMFGRNIRPVSFLYCAALTCIFSVIVNISMHNKLKKIDMVESLKSVE
jgi:putative ABC transport system permease protein